MGQVGKIASGCLGAFLVLIIGAALFLYFAVFDSTNVSYRYRLTIAVETDGQVHSASSVIEVSTNVFTELGAGLANGACLHTIVRGQAVFLDLGKRGVLFATLGGNNNDRQVVNAGELAPRAYAKQVAAILRSAGYAEFDPRDPCQRPKLIEERRAVGRMNFPVDLAADNMPAFWWFSDPTHLATAQYVKPDDFAAVIGDSARLINAQLQVTNDPVTIDLDKKWPAYAEFVMYKGMGIYTALNGLQLGSRAFVSPGDY